MKTTGRSNIAFFIALNAWRLDLPPMHPAARAALVEAWIRGWAANQKAAA